MGIQKLDTYEFRCDKFNGTGCPPRQYTVPDLVTARQIVIDAGWQVSGSHVLCPKHRVDHWPVPGVDVRELVIGA